MSLSASVKKELDRINQQPGSSVALAAERTTGGTAALSVEVDWTKGPWRSGPTPGITRISHGRRLPACAVGWDDRRHLLGEQGDWTMIEFLALIVVAGVVLYLTYIPLSPPMKDLIRERDEARAEAERLRALLAAALGER